MGVAMASRARQGKLVIPLTPTPSDYRQAALRALENPWETPDACQRRHDHYMAEAERLERERGHA